MTGRDLDSTVVAHVVDRLSGGVPVAVCDYIRNTPPGVDHVIVSPWADGAPSPIWDGVDATHVDLGASRPRQLLGIRRALRDAAADVVHAHSSFPGVFARFARPRGVRVVYSPHCFKFDDPGASRALRVVTRAAERLLARRTDVFAVLSGHEARLTVDLGSSARVARVPNASSLPLREARVLPPGEPRRIGMVGRIAAQKDPGMMIALMRELASSPSPVEAVWIGGGDEEWQHRLTEAGVRVTGWLPKERVVEELDALSLYVHTASYEGFPLSVLDAAARGIPVVARRIPSLDEVGLATFDDARSGAEAIRRAFDERGHAEALTARGERMLAQMNPGTQRDALDDVWRS